MTCQGPSHSLTSNADHLALKPMHLATVRPSHKLPSHGPPSHGLLGTRRGERQSGASGLLLSHLARPSLSLYAGQEHATLPNLTAGSCGFLHAREGGNISGWLVMSMKNTQFSQQSHPQHTMHDLCSCFSVYFLTELSVVYSTCGK